MEIKFDVFYTKNIGTIYKDNSVDIDGIEAVLDLDLSQVNYMHVNFEIGSSSYTDTVIIKDIENKIVQIPFKTDVLKQGINQFEIVATMKNGDVKPSQTCKYYVVKSLENSNSVEAETNYPILIDLINRVTTGGGTVEGHTHTNKTILDIITQEKLTSWDGKLDSVPSEYITETELNSKGYLTQHQDISMKVDKVIGKSLIADTEIARLAGVTNYEHPSTHLPSIITQDANNRFVTDAEKTTWNAKSDFDGDYNSLTNIPSAYELPIATASTLGGIKVGAGLSITAGVLSTTGGGVADSVEWGNIQNKPSVFTPATHTHTKADITDFAHVHSYDDLTDKPIIFDGNYNNLNNKPIIPIVTNDLTNTLKSNYDSAYTHSQETHAPVDAQKNSDITKAEIEEKLVGVISSHSHSSNLVTTSIVGTTLTLTTDRYQATTMVDGTEIILPTVTEFTEIHLFFSASTDMTLILPSCKWQSQPTISANKHYELIFTYTTEWLGGVIVYG